MIVLNGLRNGLTGYGKYISDTASVAGYSGMEELLCYASSLLDPLLSDCFYNI